MDNNITLEQIREHRELKWKIISEMSDDYRMIFENSKNIYLKHLKLKESINNIYYELENVKGYDYTKIKHTFNKDEYINKYYQLSDELEKLEKKDKFYMLYINSMIKLKNSIVDKKLREEIEIAYFEI